MKKDGDLVLRKKWIQWALDFAQMDLNSLPPVRKKSLLAEMAFFCSETPLEDGWEEFEQFEDQLLSLAPGEYEGVIDIDDTGKPINITKLQKSAFEFLKALNSIHNSRREDRAIERIFVGHLPKESFYIVSPFPGTFEIKRSPTIPTAKNWLILNFIGLIDQFEDYPVKKCKGCNRFFLHLTKIEKLYCTSSCAARSIQKAKREELYQDPEKHQAFLKKWNKYQKERYKERLKVKLGPTVKVGRKED